LKNNDTGSSLVGVGKSALTANTSAANNTAVGQNALSTCQTGGGNSAYGQGSLGAVLEGTNNTGIGHQTGTGVNSGSNNLLLGYQAGNSASPSGNVTTASNQICLGNNNITDLFCADTTISSSDSRDKTDVATFNIGLAWINALRPVTYRWDRRTWYGTEETPYGTPNGSKKRSKLHIGFLAQETLEVEKANGYGSSNDDSLLVNLTNDGMSYGIKYERLVPILVNAIKELSAKVTALEAG